MLKEVTRFTGLECPSAGTATAQEAIEVERRALRMKRLVDLGIHERKDHSDTLKLATLEKRFDDIVDAIAAADAQFEADNKAFLKKHRVAAGEAS